MCGREVRRRRGRGQARQGGEGESLRRRFKEEEAIQGGGEFLRRQSIAKAR